MCFTILQLESEKSIKNATEWALSQYYANYSSFFNTTDVPPPAVHPADVIRGPCWETAVGIVSRGIIQLSQLAYFYSVCSFIPLLTPLDQTEGAKCRISLIMVCICSSSCFFFSCWLLMLLRNLWSWSCQTFRWHIWPSWLVTLRELSLSASSTTAGVGTWRPDLWVLAMCVSGSWYLCVHYVVCFYLFG